MKKNNVKAFNTLIGILTATSCSSNNPSIDDKIEGVASQKPESHSTYDERPESMTSRRRGRCLPPTMSCSLTDSTVSNEEYASATVVCTVPFRSCVSSVAYDGGDLGTGSLTRYGKTFVGTIDTEAVAAGTYNLEFTGTDSRASTTATLSLDVADLYSPSLSCSVTDGANDGSQDMTLLCTIEDETAMGSAYYISSLDSDSMTNSSGSTYEATLDVTGLPSEEQTFSVFALDNAGNVSYTELTGQINDASSPTVTSVYTDVSSVLNDGTESFLVYACFSDETDDTALGGSVTATIDSVVETLSYDSGSSCFISSSISGNNFSEGTYTINVTGADAAGNTVTDNSASIDVTDPDTSSCPYTCASNLCLYVDGSLEAELNTAYPSWMTSIDTIRLGHSGQYFDNLTLVVDEITYVSEDFNTDIGCFNTGTTSSGNYLTDSTDNECSLSSFDATTTEWMISIDVIAGSDSPNLALRNSSYTAAPGSNWGFAPDYYLNDGAGNTVGFTSGTPDTTVDHTLIMCNLN